MINVRYRIARPEELDRLVNKIVRFPYEGGQRPGHVRTIRVEEVRFAKGRHYLKGPDLEHPELTDGKGFRQYDTRKISGFIDVVN